MRYSEVAGSSIDYRALAVLASVRVQTVIGLPCLQTTACRLLTQNTRKTDKRLDVYCAFLKGETSGFPSQTHPFPESLCVTPKWRVLPLIIAPAFVLRCNTGSITSGILTSHLAYCSTSVHPRDFCRFGFCSYRAKVHSHAVLRARTLAVLASVRVQTVIGSLCLQTTACRLHPQNTRRTANGWMYTVRF